jgi:hypothetical protein
VALANMCELLNNFFDLIGQTGWPKRLAKQIKQLFTFYSGTGKDRLAAFKEVKQLALKPDAIKLVRDYLLNHVCTLYDSGNRARKMCNSFAKSTSPLLLMFLKSKSAIFFCTNLLSY